MRVRTFEELIETYSETISGLAPDYINERNDLLTRYKISVIVEGEFSELENLEKWTEENINEVSVAQVWYGKIAYDFGLVEYFFEDGKNATKFTTIIPNLYTTYSHSGLPNLVCKTDGYEKKILYNSTDPTSVLFK